VNSVECDLDVPATFGRGLESRIPLDGTGISREHFQLHSLDEKPWITDLSTNGTWLNGKRLNHNEPQVVAFGDEINIPGFKIRVESTVQAASHQESNARRPDDSSSQALPKKNLPHHLRKYLAPFSFVEKALVLSAFVIFALVLTYALSN
jgi:pSer/pThr/pTyr-binding forkhead associated (FHA) protein